MSPTEPAVGTPLLAVTGLRKRFGEHEVLRSVDLTVRTGEVVAVIGSSGSGKTTLLRCLNGLEVADAGTVAVGDGVTIDFAARSSSASAGSQGSSSLHCSSGSSEPQAGPRPSAAHPRRFPAAPGRYTYGLGSLRIREAARS